MIAWLLLGARMVKTFTHNAIKTCISLATFHTVLVNCLKPLFFLFVRVLEVPPAATTSHLECPRTFLRSC